MAYKLYTKEFYKIVSDHLTTDGDFVCDGTTVHYTTSGYEWWEYGKQLKTVFPVVFPYHFNSKRMPGGEFVLLWASKSEYPVEFHHSRGLELKTNYYDDAIHEASFVLTPAMWEKWK